MKYDWIRVLLGSPPAADAHPDDQLQTSCRAGTQHLAAMIPARHCGLQPRLLASADALAGVQIAIIIAFILHMNRTKIALLDTPKKIRNTARAVSDRDRATPSDQQACLKCKHMLIIALGFMAMSIITCWGFGASTVDPLALAPFGVYLALST